MASFYKGWNVHSYTSDLQIHSNLIDFFRNEPSLSHDEWHALLDELRSIYGNMDALRNMNNVFVKSMWSIPDPQLSNLDSAKVLRYLWKNHIRHSASLRSHFRETLQDIGHTCIQGISHRLIALFVALNDASSTPIFV